MKATCPHCGTTYRIDPSKVPVGGVQARCSRCGQPFRIQGEPGGAVASAAPARASAPAAATPADPAMADAAGHLDPLPELTPRHAPPAAPVPPSLPTPPRAPAPVAHAAGDPVPPPPSPSPIFGRPDPHGKARRLARALISDIAVYHPERRDRGLQQGTLRQEFREEIKKSWDEYVAQVGDSLARGTPYFREALNEILAGGRAVF